MWRAESAAKQPCDSRPSQYSPEVKKAPLSLAWVTLAISQ